MTNHLTSRWIGIKTHPESVNPLLVRREIRLKQTLGGEVAEVRASDRLTDSVACLIAPEFGPDRQLEKMLAAHGRIGERAKPILELNPTHPLTLALASRFRQGADKPLIEDAAWLVLDEARLMEGASVEDPAAFGARLRRVMEKALG